MHGWPRNTVGGAEPVVVSGTTRHHKGQQETGNQRHVWQVCSIIFLLRSRYGPRWAHGKHHHQYHHQQHDPEEFDDGGAVGCRQVAR